MKRLVQVEDSWIDPDAIEAITPGAFGDGSVVALASGHKIRTGPDPEELVEEIAERLAKRAAL